MEVRFQYTSRHSTTWRSDFSKAVDTLPHGGQISVHQSTQYHMEVRFQYTSRHNTTWRSDCATSRLGTTWRSDFSTPVDTVPHGGQIVQPVDTVPHRGQISLHQSTRYHMVISLKASEERSGANDTERGSRAKTHHGSYQ